MRRAAEALLVASALAGTAGAQTTAFVQGQWGARFDDAVYGLNTANREMSTILLNADASWGHGDVNFFVRSFTGAFVDVAGARTGQGTITYAEWTTRLGLLPRATRDSLRGPVRDVFVALQLNRGTGTHTDLVGAGAKLRLGALRTTNTLYYRKPRGGVAGAKWRTSWYLPASLARLGVWTDGSLDVVTRTPSGTDWCFMPAALVDVGRPLGLAPGALGIGSEWFLHRARGASLNAPQVVVRWSF